MQIKKIIRCQVVYILLVVLFVLAVIFNINTGNVHISPARIFRIIFLHGDMGTPEYNIIWKIRLPHFYQILPDETAWIQAHIKYPVPHTPASAVHKPKFLLYRPDKK